MIQTKKNMNKTKLIIERATDLASKLSVEEIAGLRNGIINDERVGKYKH